MRFSPDVRIVWRNFGGSFLCVRYPVPEGVFSFLGWVVLERCRFA
jgi:hypothetical protein